MIFDDELTEFTLADLQEMAATLIRNMPADDNLLQHFFSAALLRFYSPEFENTVFLPEVGDLLYRLSDRLSPARRSTIMIYPDEGGDIVNDPGLRSAMRWDSLERWRQQWEEQRPEGIATFAPELTAPYAAITAA